MRGEQETDEWDSGKEGKSWKLNTVSVFVDVLLGTKIQQWKKRGGKENKTNTTTVTSLYTYFKKI